MITKHTHQPEGTDTLRCYSGSVAVEPYTDENRAAHGNVTYTERCATCGAERDVNANQGFEEYSPWGPTQAARDARERERQHALRLRQTRIRLGDASVTEARGYLVELARTPSGCRAITRAGYAAILDAPGRGDDPGTLSIARAVATIKAQQDCDQ